MRPRGRASHVVLARRMNAFVALWLVVAVARAHEPVVQEVRSGDGSPAGCAPCDSRPSPDSGDSADSDWTRILEVSAAVLVGVLAGWVAHHAWRAYVSGDSGPRDDVADPASKETNHHAGGEVIHPRSRSVQGASDSAGTMSFGSGTRAGASRAGAGKGVTPSTPAGRRPGRDEQDGRDDAHDGPRRTSDVGSGGSENGAGSPMEILIAMAQVESALTPVAPPRVANSDDLVTWWRDGLAAGARRASVYLGQVAGAEDLDLRCEPVAQQGLEEALVRVHHQGRCWVLPGYEASLMHLETHYDLAPGARRPDWVANVLTVAMEEAGTVRRGVAS